MTEEINNNVTVYHDYDLRSRKEGSYGKLTINASRTDPVSGEVTHKKIFVIRAREKRYNDFVLSCIIFSILIPPLGIPLLIGYAVNRKLTKKRISIDGHNYYVNKNDYIQILEQKNIITNRKYVPTVLDNKLQTYANENFSKLPPSTLDNPSRERTLRVQMVEAEKTGNYERIDLLTRIGAPPSGLENISCQVLPISG